MGFNRYMVECEYKSRNLELADQSSFNRYMVECEYTRTGSETESATVLIDTWWNVNDFFTEEIENLLNVLIDTWWNVN